MHVPGPRLSAVLTVVVAAATGVVTNLITNRWTWTLTAILAALLIISGALAALTAGGKKDNRTRIRQRARGNSLIHGSGIRAGGAAEVTQDARHRGKIIRSPIGAHQAEIAQNASNSSIADSPIAIDKEHPPAQS
jgi:hypothetical protein